METLCNAPIKFKNLVLLLTIFNVFTVSALGDISNSVVKVYVTYATPNYYTPWIVGGPRSRVGSGSIIEGNKILTNAHVVANETFIQVRLHGSTKKYRAEVISVSHQTDLAILKVNDKDFFEGTSPLSFGKLPKTQEKVLVYGFPVGGETLSTTEGIVSRIEHRSYAHSSGFFLAGQIDAAINGGNSGGPVISNDKIVGVVMQSRNNADNIGYMVPVPVVKQFLNDIKDGTNDGYPGLGIGVQSTENQSLRDYYKMSEDQTGVLVTKVSPDSPLKDKLLEGDIILEIEAHPIANDGTIEFRKNERTFFSYYVQNKQIGDTLSMKILREGTISNIETTLSLPDRSMHLIQPERYDEAPQYYIYGGLVFTPLNKNFLRSWGKDWYNEAPKNLVAKLYKTIREKKDEEVVIVQAILSSDVNEDYENLKYNQIKKANNEEVLNLKHLISIIEQSTDPFIVLENNYGNKVILNRQQAEESHKDILTIYRINKDRNLR